MAISEREVRGIARLARLRLTSEEVEKYRAELSSILEYMKQLAKVDISDVDCVTRSAVAADSLRQDRAGDSLSIDEALENAPSVVHNMFSVPRVIDN